MIVASVPAAAVEFLGVDLCVGSVDTSVVLPVGSPLSLESAEIGRYGGLLLLFKADNGDIMDHIDNLMSFYSDTRGTGDAKKLQWTGNQITAYAQLIKKDYAALAVSTTDDCLAVESDPTAARVPEIKHPEQEAEPEELTEHSEVAAATAAIGATTAVVEEIAAVEKPEAIVVATIAVADESAASATLPEPEPPTEFMIKGRLKHSTAEDGWVDVMGVVVNNSGTAYSVASFDLSLYDGSGELICVDTVSVNQLRDGQERAFRSAIRCADYDAEAVTDWKLQFAGAH
ncbi:MAG: FxLYD domain-containing protein [Thermoanaerobaculales bacterium]|nr:FxLYD domain-containing protein [Thermoanaerobaculales bacterium]